MKPDPEDEALSPALHFLTLLWRGKCEALPHAWTTINAGMSSGLLTAIRTGLRFDAEDFQAIATRFYWIYWNGADNGKNAGERFYTAAAEARHIGACQSFEALRGRKPFLVHGNRLHLGSTIP